jgi:hypothetical protein
VRFLSLKEIKKLIRYMQSLRYKKYLDKNIFIGERESKRRRRGGGGRSESLPASLQLEFSEQIYGSGQELFETESHRSMDLEDRGREG